MVVSAIETEVDLSESSDERFDLVEIKRPVGSQLGIVIVQWRG